jgi:hypothetical protein
VGEFRELIHALFSTHTCGFVGLLFENDDET